MNERCTSCFEINTKTNWIVFQRRKLHQQHSLMCNQNENGDGGFLDPFHFSLIYNSTFYATFSLLRPNICEMVYVVLWKKLSNERASKCLQNFYSQIELHVEVWGHLFTAGSGKLHSDVIFLRISHCNLLSRYSNTHKIK